MLGALWTWLIIALTAICHGVFAAVKDSTLIVYDARRDNLDEYSEFLGLFKDGYATLDLSLKGSKLESDIQYANLVVLPATSKMFNRLVTAQVLLKRVDEGSNIIFVTEPNAVPDSLRLFANQLGIYPSPRNYRLVDHFQEGNDINVDSESIRMGPSGLRAKVGNSSTALLENRLSVLPILQAPRTSYTTDDEKSWAEGNQGFLIVGFQALNNARVTWLGSKSLLHNSYADVNSELIKYVTHWTFQDIGQIRSVGAKHNHADGTSYTERPYKVKDVVEYSIGLQQWNGVEWVPYVADDVQFELRQVDPYYRITMVKAEARDGIQYYTTKEFALPDRPGMFTFAVDYRNASVSFVTESEVYAIRHLAHDEYARSYDISNAWVYLTSIFGVSAVWFLFVILFVTVPGAQVSSAKKTN